ncbi:hypothetical protein WN51_00710 [Melipona quadrifasciata]|uniref:Uncharacterized protein n=1 Tax=Melipona quadrifasciata TaxID=166423 RepID=A0A0M8ZWW4_9HYME|nr:hypothetical protein WN51_00710 [Melipona quadrifasciata]
MISSRRIRAFCRGRQRSPLAPNEQIVQAYVNITIIQQDVSWKSKADDCSLTIKQERKLGKAIDDNNSLTETNPR